MQIQEVKNGKLVQTIQPSTEDEGFDLLLFTIVTNIASDFSIPQKEAKSLAYKMAKEGLLVVLGEKDESIGCIRYDTPKVSRSWFWNI